MTDKLPSFLTLVGKYIARNIIDCESELYNKVPESKRDVLKSISIKTIIGKIIQKKYNDIFCDVIDRRRTLDKLEELTSFYEHSKLGLLYLLAPISVEIELCINRTGLDISNIKEYIVSLSKLLNDVLNEKLESIATKLIKNINDDTWSDERINDENILKNREPFNFKIEVS